MHPTLRTSLLTCVLMICCSAMAAAADQNWPQFRGPQARGVSDNDQLPVKWSATENVEWKRDVPGRGWSSPIVWGDRVFLTSAINSAESEKPKKGLYFGGNRPKPQSNFRWMVYCLDLHSGNIVWQKQVHEGAPDSGIHLKNSFASESAVTDGERVYAYFGNLGIFCFDLAGEPVWEKRLAAHKTRYGWGTAASPVLHDNRLYIVNDNDDESYLLALDARTGTEIWRIERDEQSNWATPFIWQNDLRTEIVTPGTGKVRSYDPDGKLLWEFGGMSSITIATPYEYNGLLYVSSGYVGDKRRRPIFAMKPGADGDISLGTDETSNEWIVWCQQLAGPYNPSTLIYDDLLVVLYDFGFIAAFNPTDGAEVVPKRRIPQGKAFTSSPWAYAGKVFCLNEDGITFVMSSTDELELLYRNTLADDDMAMATPAIVGDRLLIRTSARVYCIRNDAGDN
ncbi:MAG: PQQ-binding-like beta-propeller repeat protein [Planctomycetaceae bacterium]